MTFQLKDKQTEFLKLLVRMDDISVLHLSPEDKKLIDETLTHKSYYKSDRKSLDRLRTRWYGSRPDANSDEWY